MVAASTALGTQEGVYQIIVFFIGRTQGQAARFKKVAASKLASSEASVLAIV